MGQCKSLTTKIQDCFGKSRSLTTKIWDYFGFIMLAGAFVFLYVSWDGEAALPRAAAIVSFLSLGFSALTFRSSRALSMRPVVVFILAPANDSKERSAPDQKEGETLWLCNVGNGPAINIVVATRDERNKSPWKNPERIATLAANTASPITYGGDQMQCDYFDIDGRRYSSSCADAITSFPTRGRLRNIENNGTVCDIADRSILRASGLPRTL